MTDDTTQRPDGSGTFVDPGRLFLERLSQGTESWMPLREEPDGSLLLVVENAMIQVEATAGRDRHAGIATVTGRLVLDGAQRLGGDSLFRLGGHGATGAVGLENEGRVIAQRARIPFRTGLPADLDWCLELASNVVVTQFNWFTGLLDFAEAGGQPLETTVYTPTEDDPEGLRTRREQNRARMPRDLSVAAGLARRAGLLAFSDEGGMTAELPWTDEGPSAVTGARTALVRLCTDQPHPFLGEGLLAALHLPVAPTRDAEIRSICRLLEAAESAWSNAPPRLGTWCADPLAGAGVAYVCFFPTLAYVPGLAGSLLTWFASLNMLAADVLEKREADGKPEAPDRESPFLYDTWSEGTGKGIVFGLPRGAKPPPKK